MISLFNLLAELILVLTVVDLLGLSTPYFNKLVLLRHSLTSSFDLTILNSFIYLVNDECEIANSFSISVGLKFFTIYKSNKISFEI